MKIQNINFKFLLSWLLLVAAFTVSAFGQNALFRPCPGSTAQAKVEIDKAGNINFVPCPTKTYLFNGQPLNLNAIGQLNGLNGFSQTFAIGSAGASPTWASVGTVHTLNLPTVTGANTGLVTPSLYNTWNTAAGVYGSLTTNFFPKWNGSAFANSQISETASGFANTIRLNAQNVTIGDVFTGGNGKKLVFTDVGANNFTFTGTAVFNSNVTTNADLNAANIVATNATITNLTAGNISFGNQAINTVFAAPSSGSAGAPSFRSLVAADIPGLPASQITSGVIATARLGTGTANSTTYLRGDGTWAAITGGTVTSVDLSLPGIFNVTGSPVTTSGTITATLANQTANTVFASPANGSTGAPLFRSLVSADIPSLDTSKITTGNFATARLGTGTANSTTYLRGDGTWAAIAASGTFTDGSNNFVDLTFTPSTAVTSKIRYEGQSGNLISSANSREFQFLDNGTTKIFGIGNNRAVFNVPVSAYKPYLAVAANTSLTSDMIGGVVDISSAPSVIYTIGSLPDGGQLTVCGYNNSNQGSFRLPSGANLLSNTGGFIGTTTAGNSISPNGCVIITKTNFSGGSYVLMGNYTVNTV